MTPVYAFNTNLHIFSLFQHIIHIIEVLVHHYVTSENPN